MQRERENYKIDRFRDHAGEWRWKMTDLRNSKIVGSATEGYVDVRDCDHNLYIVTGWKADD